MIIQSLRIKWAVEERSSRFFASETVTGGGEDGDGSVLIGPFDSKSAAEAVIEQRRNAMGGLMLDLRLGVELLKGELVKQRAAA